MPPKADKSDTKLDQILEQLKQLDQLTPMAQKIHQLHSSLGTLKGELGSLTFTIQGHEDRLTALETDMMAQKELANNQQQQLRSLTIRLLNVPTTVGESTNNFAWLRDIVYNRFLTPLLAAAKDNGVLSEIPPMNSLIESCFRPYAAIPDKLPPPIIIKLTNRPLKIAVMSNKKELPKPTAFETSGGVTRFILVEDLTPDNHRCLSALSKSKLTGKVWSVDGRIKYTMADKPDAVLTVKSVFDPITTILRD